ncbi:hypothetical protein [Laspinema olomoucense]|uniref:hypothetical protein n=1 Tax=Laspinema olomoucense TaxID=3231600 RepID=UPI0021BB3AC6|nr:hypothetical protein [Laspinema sp. D3d]MCT7970466.1 hypothetical protein [Laspinema sp. D3d]
MELFNFISGPLPLARGGLGWGPLEGDSLRDSSAVRRVTRNRWVEGVGGDVRSSFTKKEVGPASRRDRLLEYVMWR